MGIDDLPEVWNVPALVVPAELYALHVLYALHDGGGFGFIRRVVR